MQTLVLLFGSIGLGGLLLTYIHLRGRREALVARDQCEQRRRSLQRNLEMMTERYDLVRTAVDVSGWVALGLDARAEALLVATAREDSPDLALQAVDPRDLVDAEVVEHVYGFAKKSGAAVEATVRAVELRLFLANPSDPVRVMGFLVEEAGFGSSAHCSARDEALSWQGLVRALIHSLRNASAPANRMAELEAAARAGELTPQELQREKARVLADRYLAHRERVTEEMAQRQTRPARERETSG